MARKQTLGGDPSVTVTTSGTAVPLSATSVSVVSVSVQALDTNIDYAYLCSPNGDRVHSLQPGESVNITGDGLDQGTGAYVDLNEIYIDAENNGDGVRYAILQGI